MIATSLHLLGMSAAWLRSPLPLVASPAALASRAAVAMQEAAATSGNEEWGQWSHTALDINVELILDEHTDARSLAVDMAEGWLFAGSDLNAEKGGLRAPLLYGRLAQPVLADELVWTLDNREVWDLSLIHI